MLKLMRRLPVYFLLDVSESMVGEPLEAVEAGMRSIVEDMRGDPYALETMYIAVIVFAGGAEVQTPLAELIEFQSPRLPIGCGTSLGTGLKLLMERIDADIQKTTSQTKGDWKPLVFLFTDGAPTDKPQHAIDRWNSDYRKNANLVAVTFGEHADMPLLNSLTDNVLMLKNTTREAFGEFFRWVSASLQVSSMAVHESREGSMRLADCGINLEKGPVKGILDENYAILPMRCITNGKLWLAKYAKIPTGWHYIGSYPIDEDAYNRLGGNKGRNAGSLELADIDRSPKCPICNGNHGIVHCACGGLSCMPRGRADRCPWCNTEIGEVRMVNNLEVNRSKG